MVLALAGCSGGSSNSNPQTTNTSANVPANNSSPLVQAQVYAQQKTDLASLNQAVQQYHAAEGHYPANLQDLTPTYLQKIPAVPAGYKINYNPGSGVVTLANQ